MLKVCAILAFLCGACTKAALCEDWRPLGKMSAPDVIEKLEQRNAERSVHQPPIVCERLYTLDYKGFPVTKHAEMKVRAESTRDGKSLVIVSESGSESLRNHVLHKLLEGEREASRPEIQSQTKISRENDEFRLEEVQGGPEHPTYLLDMVPRHKNKFAWHGRIWVDGIDFAVVRAEGAPERMPSWWTTSSTFSYTNQAVKDQWIPERNTSLTQVRFGGQADLEIKYNNCHEGPSATEAQVR